MPFKTEVIPDAPIIVHTLEPGPGVVAEIPQAMQEVAETVGAQPRPVYLVLDLRGLKMGLDDMMVTSDKAGRGPDALPPRQGTLRHSLCPAPLGLCIIPTSSRRCS